MLAPAAAFLHRDLREQPVAGARLLHRDVDDGHFGAGLEHGHLAVQQFGEDERLFRPPLEPAPVQRARSEHDRAGLDARDPAHRHEDAPPGDLDQQAEHPRRLSAQPQRDDHVTNAADRVPVGVQHEHTGEAGAKDPSRGGAHASDPSMGAGYRREHR